MEVDDDILEAWIKIDGLKIDILNTIHVEGMPLDIKKEISKLRNEYLHEAKEREFEMNSLNLEVERQRRDLDIEILYVEKISREPVTCDEHAQTVQSLQEQLQTMKRTYQTNKARYESLKRRVLGQTASVFATLPNLNGFQLRNLIGRGVTSEVWQAYSIATRSFVALKVCNNLKIAEMEYSNHKMIATNSTRYTVPVYSLDWATFQQVPYGLMSMKCMQYDLAHYLELNGTCSPYLARHILRELVIAIAYMHKCNMAHCDLKPGNVMVTDVNVMHLQLTDFHLSRCKSDSISIGVNASPGYAPPEWYHDVLATTYEKFDIWSLGVIFYQCLFHAHPMGSFKTKRELRESMISYTKLPRDLSFPMDISDHDKTILRLCLNPHSEKRPTAEELSQIISFPT